MFPYELQEADVIKNALRQHQLGITAMNVKIKGKPEFINGSASVNSKQEPGYINVSSGYVSSTTDFTDLTDFSRQEASESVKSVKSVKSVVEERDGLVGATAREPTCHRSTTEDTDVTDVSRQDASESVKSVKSVVQYASPELTLY